MSSPLTSLPEGCDNSSSEPTEVRLNAAALADPSSLHIPVSLPQFSFSSAKIPTSALVDSGSTHCFIDPTFIKKHSLPTTSISPVTLRLLDGTVGVVITQAANICITFSTNDILTLKFYVTRWILPQRLFLVTIGCTATIRRLIGLQVNYFTSDDFRYLSQALVVQDPPVQLSRLRHKPLLPALCILILFHLGLLLCLFRLPKIFLIILSLPILLFLLFLLLMQLLTHAVHAYLALQSLQ